MEKSFIKFNGQKELHEVIGETGDTYNYVETNGKVYPVLKSNLNKTYIFVDFYENPVQPPPEIKLEYVPVGELVIKDIEERIDVGKKRYGIVLMANNGRDPIRDLREELIDALMYLKQLEIEIAQMRKEIGNQHEILRYRPGNN